MKKICLIMALCLLMLCACAPAGPGTSIVATTRPVYDLATALCQGTGLEIGLLIQENVSCLHDYSLSTTQMKLLERAELVLASGAGLESFQQELLERCAHVVSCADGVALIECEDSHDHDHDHGHDHDHAADPHIWLAPKNAMMMARNICAALEEAYPAQRSLLRENLSRLLQQLEDLQQYGEQALGSLSCRELITFHDGFSYLAQAFDLTILAAVEEESGSEASARELIELIGQVRQHDLPAVFCEANGSRAAAQIIAAETDAGLFTLDMAMGEGNYLDTMYQNIAVLKEALG